MPKRQKRKPRFKRVHCRPIQLTDRDVEIIRQVARHRFLRSTHISALVGGSEQNLSRRLQRLYHSRYLDRPRAQLDFYARAGSSPMVYGLGNRGAALLAERFGISPRKVDWTWKNRTVGRVFLNHTLLVADIMVALACACREHGAVSLIEPEAILAGMPEATRRKRNPFYWRVTVPHNGADLPVGVVPDKVFGLEFTKERKRAFFFLEADRATMPIVRKNLRQTSMYRKVAAYYATWRQGIHTELFNVKNFRVLTVTTSADRSHNLVRANRDATEGRGSRIFLFTDIDTLASQSILELPWQNGRGEHVRLVD